MKLALQGIGFLVGLVVVIVVVGGLTEWTLGNTVAQFVRKTLLLGGTLGFAGYFVQSRLRPPPGSPPA